MKHNKRNLICISLLICISILTLFITACDESTKPESQSALGTISGIVTAPNKSPLSGVVVTIGTLTATTGSDGSFAIFDVPVASRVLVDYAKAGYISTQKVATVLANRTVNADVVMFAASVTTFANVATDIVLESSALIQVPANAFVNGSGSPFTGTVLAETRYFDPTDPAALAAFPGEFQGVQLDGSETAFESYGFISASFFDAANPTDELQLAAGKTCHLVVPIPTALLANAPATIPLWYYDTTAGKWMEQGSATKTGSSYEGNVSHFTYWNFDHPIQVTDQSTLTGVVAAADSTHAPVPGAQVVATGVSFAGYTRAYTNSQGVFSITVKASSQVRIQAFSGNISSMPTDIITTPATNGTAAVDTLFISDLNFTITGTLVDSSGNPMSNSYGRIQQRNVPAGAYPFASWFSTDANGHFSSSETFPGAGSTVSLQFSAYVMNASVYSEPIDFVIPNPGDTYSFGTVALLPGGKITGRLKDNTGEFLSGGFIYWNQEGGSGATEVFFNAPIDSLGNFLIEGPPSTTLPNMVGTVQVDSLSLTTGLRTLTFPASGNTTNIGTLVLVPETRRR